jgi:hypothetical protein
MNYTLVKFQYLNGRHDRSPGEVTVAHEGAFSEESWIERHPDRVLVSCQALFVGKPNGALASRKAG